MANGRPRDGQTPFALDKRRVREAFERAADTYDAAAVLQREVGVRMLERLQLVRVAPQRILDVGAGTGVQTSLLARRYRRADVIALDIAAAMIARARRHARWFSKQRFVCGDMDALPYRDGCADLLFSNLSVQWSNDHADFV